MHIFSHRTQKGMSLIELLVGVVIGMIGIVVIFQVLALSESRKRTTGAGSDAQISGAIALFAMERDVQQAGFGFSTSPNLGCTVNAFETVRGNFTFPLIPVQIVQGAAGAPDSIVALQGNSPAFVNTQAFTLSTLTSKTTQARGGLRPGDRIIATGTVGVGTACAMLEITGDANPNGITIDHQPSSFSYTNAAGNTVLSRHNSVAPPAFTSGFVYNLGPAPRRSIWSISGNMLAVSEDISGGAATAIAESIIDMQAEYGTDTNNDGRIANNEWSTVDPADWTKVRAIRVAILSRSGQYEKDQITTVAPSWLGNTMPTGAANSSFVMKNVDGTADSNPAGANNWRNYRYRVHETIIPLRNVIWGTAL